MDANLLTFLALVAFGAAVQTVTGFAMGLMIIAGVAALDLTAISFATAVIGFISLLNTAIALRRAHRLVDRRFFLWVSAGLVPMLVVGVWLLDWLAGAYYLWLRTLLGVVIIAAGILLMLTPKPWPAVSGRVAMCATGALGGVIAGLYSAGGAPIAYFMYRQPLDLVVIRATLLSVFAVSTLWRSIVVAGAGHLTTEVFTATAFAVPVVVVTTIGVGRVLHLVPDRLVRRFVFVLLIAVGSFLVIT